MSTFDNQRVYHSRLKYHSPVVVRFTSDVMESKYDEGTYIRWFIVKGEEDSDGHYYQIESPEIREQLEGVPAGQWVRVQAEGGGPDADSPKPVLDIQTADGPEVSSSGDSQGGSAPSQGQERLGPEPILDQYALVLEKAAQRFPEVMFDDDDNLTEIGARLATTLYIQWSKTGRKQPLYEGQGVDMAGEAKADRIEEDLDALDWDGNSHDGRDLSTVKAKMEELSEAIREDGVPVDVADNAISWLNNELEAQSQSHIEDGQVGEDSLPF